MASTSYTVFTVDAEGVATEFGTKSKKATAVELARQVRKEQTTAVLVQTNSGKAVFEQPAPKQINMSKPYTRVVELPEGALIPEGVRVCYARPRKHIALVDLGADTEERYAVVNFRTGDELWTGSTTRDAGRFMADKAPTPAKAEPEPATA